MNYKYITLHYTMNQTMNFNGKVTTNTVFSLYKGLNLYTERKSFA